MTDIISTHIGVVRRTRLASLPRVNQLGIILGYVMAATVAVAESFAMAYVTPYRPRSPIDADVDAEGRDPNW